MKQRKYVPKASAVGMRRALASFAVVAIGVTGITGANVSADENSLSDHDLLEAAISQTGPAAEAAGTSVASDLTATQYKQVRELTATVIDKLEANGSAESLVVGLRSGDPITVDESIVAINDEVTAALEADGGVDQILGDDSLDDGYGGKWKVWTKYLLAYKVGVGLKYIAVVSAVWKFKTFWNADVTADQLVRDEAIANMTSAWAD